MKEKLIAKGIDIHGEEREFDCTDGCFDCSFEQLVSIVIPEGVYGVYCSNNQLTELKIPEGAKAVSCWNNQLTELKLPESVIRLWTDKEVMGLEKYIGKVKIYLD